MTKRVMWVILVTAMMTVAGLVARRLSTRIWGIATGEEPPTESV